MSKTASITEIKNVQVKTQKKRSRYSREGFEPIQNGFMVSTSKDIPYGYNYALGYCTETVEDSLRKKYKDMS